ncbi:MAG: polysaccharide export protein [Acidobacteria bacterium]|nr:polysaccharide export protein [Acidobacteriota bacterium]
MKKIFIICVVLLGFICGLPAQEQDGPEGSYVIGEEDILSITVRGEPEFSVRDRSVRMDGRIALPMFGEIHASGKTAQQLEEEITKKLEYLVKNPVVIVVVDKVISHRVTVAGQVGKPGLYAITAPTTVLEIIVRAGGPTQNAKGKRIRIVRQVNGREVQFPFNYDDVIKGRNLRQNILLENRDMILVP